MSYFVVISKRSRNEERFRHKLRRKLKLRSDDVEKGNEAVKLQIAMIKHPLAELSNCPAPIAARGLVGHRPTTVDESARPATTELTCQHFVNS